MGARKKQMQCGEKMPQPAASGAPHPLFTIGHSTHDFAHLLGLLQLAKIAFVADVRSTPYSQRLPQYNREELQKRMHEGGIDYTFLGQELGGRPRDERLYDEEMRVDYERVRQSPAFQGGLDRLCRALEGRQGVLLCSEEDPLDCHRALMVGPALIARGIAPIHLRGDGSMESTDELETRLLAETGVGSGILDGLFANTLSSDDRRELLDQAYRVQARKKAYRIRQGEQFE
jgi:hypothetical protein